MPLVSHRSSNSHRNKTTSWRLAQPFNPHLCGEVRFAGSFTLVVFYYLVFALGACCRISRGTI